MYYTHYYNPHQSMNTQRYGLRPRLHDRTLPERTSNLVDCNFIIRILYLNAYWLNIRLRHNVLFFTVCRSYISHCVSKCVMSSCLLNDFYWLIDWLIDLPLNGCASVCMHVYVVVALLEDYDDDEYDVFIPCWLWEVVSLLEYSKQWKI